MIISPIVALDTNIWIYLAVEPKLEPVFNTLKEQITNRTATIIANDIIRSEWTRNKDNTIANAIKNYKRLWVAINNIADSFTSPDKEAFKEYIKKAKLLTLNEETAKNKVDDVEQLLFQSVCTSATDEQKLHIANLAINNKPPFHHSKNNFNDALIIRNLCQYVSENISVPKDTLPGPGNHFIYLSNNPKDFIDPDTEQVFPDILAGIDLNFELVNMKSLPSALHLSKELSDEYDAWLDYAESCILDQMYREWEISIGK